MKYFILSILCILISLKLHSQESSVTNKNLIQLSGVVISSDSLDQIPFTTIYHKGNKRGTISDYHGYFSIVVFPSDTLLFSSYGHKTSSFIVPDTLKEDRYSIIHIMHQDTINIPSVTVYPWPSKDDFARAFLEMKPYDDALRRAQKQLSGVSLAFISAQVHTDPGLSYSWQQNQQNTKLYTSGQSPVNNLFNPYSWAKFIESWKTGKLGKE